MIVVCVCVAVMEPAAQLKTVFHAPMIAVAASAVVTECAVIARHAARVLRTVVFARHAETASAAWARHAPRARWIVAYVIAVATTCVPTLRLAQAVHRTVGNAIRAATDSVVLKTQKTASLARPTVMLAQVVAMECVTPERRTALPVQVTAVRAWDAAMADAGEQKIAQVAARIAASVRSAETVCVKRMSLSLAQTAQATAVNVVALRVSRLQDASLAASTLAVVAGSQDSARAA